MAKKKNNTLLYAGLGIAALFLLKKRDSGMAGVGASKKTSILIDGKKKLVPFITGMLSSNLNDDVDFVNHGDYTTGIITYPTIKQAIESLNRGIERLQEDDGLFIKKYKIGKDTKYFITHNLTGDKYTVSLVKGGVKL